MLAFKRDPTNCSVCRRLIQFIVRQTEVCRTIKGLETWRDAQRKATCRIRSCRTRGNGSEPLCCTYHRAEPLGRRHPPLPASKHRPESLLPQELRPSASARVRCSDHDWLSDKTCQGRASRNHV